MRLELDDRERQILDDTNQLRKLTRDLAHTYQLLHHLKEPVRRGQPTKPTGRPEPPAPANLHVLDLIARVDLDVTHAAWLTSDTTGATMPRGTYPHVTLARLRMIRKNAALTARTSASTVSEINNTLAKTLDTAAAATGTEKTPHIHLTTCPHCNQKSLWLNPRTGQARCTNCKGNPPCSNPESQSQPQPPQSPPTGAKTKELPSTSQSPNHYQ